MNVETSVLCVCTRKAHTSTFIYTHTYQHKENNKEHFSYSYGEEFNDDKARVKCEYKDCWKHEAALFHLLIPIFVEENFCFVYSAPKFQLTPFATALCG